MDLQYACRFESFEIHRDIFGKQAQFFRIQSTNQS